MGFQRLQRLQMGSRRVYPKTRVDGFILQFLTHSELIRIFLNR